jgi:hypothetical protein
MQGLFPKVRYWPEGNTRHPRFLVEKNLAQITWIEAGSADHCILSAGLSRVVAIS